MDISLFHLTLVPNGDTGGSGAEQYRSVESQKEAGNAHLDPEDNASGLDKLVQGQSTSSGSDLEPKKFYIYSRGWLAFGVTKGAVALAQLRLGIMSLQAHVWGHDIIAVANLVQWIYVCLLIMLSVTAAYKNRWISNCSSSIGALYMGLAGL